MLLGSGRLRKWLRKSVRIFLDLFSCKTEPPRPNSCDFNKKHACVYKNTRFCMQNHHRGDKRETKDSKNKKHNFTKKMRTAISCRTHRLLRRELSRGVHFFKNCGSEKTPIFILNIDIGGKSFWDCGVKGLYMDCGVKDSVLCKMWMVPSRHTEGTIPCLV